MDTHDPRLLLAQRLRALREHCLPDRKVRQAELARALGGGKPLSVPLVSSWESQANPRIPPLARLEGYAAVFAAPRCLAADPPRVLSRAEMTDGELQAMAELRRELVQLRNEALRATPASSAPEGDATQLSLPAGPWRFAEDQVITIVCARWPQHMLTQMPYTDQGDPDYIDMLNYSDLDALFELHGHVRATNPFSDVYLRMPGKLVPDDYSSHLAVLGGVDWNTATRNVLSRLELPVQQIADWSVPDGQYFEVQDNGKTVRHHAVVDRRSGNSGGAGQDDGKGILREDVALFARAVNPWNRRRTVTICHGMYGRGTYGAVRTLTDKRFRDRNAEYVQSRFGGRETYCILTRVPIVDGATLTPDWTTGEYTLFEWSR